MFQQTPEQLFMSGSDKQQDANSIKSKRENYAIEIRNKTRQTLFSTRRKQLLEESKDHSDGQDFKQQLVSFMNNDNPVNALKNMKIGINSEFERYPSIWQDQDGQKFVGRLVEIIDGSPDNVLAYLAAYHLNNMIYYAEGRLNQIPELVNILIRRLQSSVKVDDLQTASSVLYCLANIYGDEDIYQDQRIKSNHCQLGGLLHELVMQVQINKDHQIFTNGFCWLLRNLSFQDGTYQTFGQSALKCCDILWSDIQKYMVHGDLGQQIAEDTLLTIKYVADKCSDDELSSFFDVHINLMIGVVTYKWPPQQQHTMAQVLKNLSAGQDDVLEQLMSLGVLELIEYMIQTKPLSQQPCLIGALANFFYADDEEIIIKVLETLNKDKVLSELITSLQDPNYNNNTLRALCNLVKNYPEISGDLLSRDIVSLTVQTLLQKMSLDTEEDGLELLDALIEQDLNDHECEMELEVPTRVQQTICACGGQLMLEQFISSKNEKTAQWAVKILRSLMVEQ